MSDGHSGLNREKTAEWTPGIFRAVLSTLSDASGGVVVILHLTSTTSYSSGLQPRTFLRSLGFHPFSGLCPFLDNGCFWKEVARVGHQAVAGLRYREEMQSLYQDLGSFMNRFAELYEVRKKEHDILATLAWEQGGLEIFNSPVPVIKAQQSAMPTWIGDVEFQPLRELRTTRRAIDSRIAELTRFLPLIYETDTALENAVVEALRYLGLKAEKTEQGFTVDVLAETGDGSRTFGIEVTGVTGPIKKDSKKLTQLNQFLLEREHEEKAVLVANTFRDVPVAERSGEHFTAPVLKHFDGREVLLMTGWDLYRLIGDVIEQRTSKEDVVALLHESSGQFSPR